jgi:hypothetical protein
MRILGYSLGQDGSTLYRTGTDDYFLLPCTAGWLLERHGMQDGVFEYAEHWIVSRRNAALEIIERVLA